MCEHSTGCSNDLKAVSRARAAIGVDVSKLFANGCQSRPRGRRGFDVALGGGRFAGTGAERRELSGEEVQAPNRHGVARSRLYGRAVVGIGQL